MFEVLANHGYQTGTLILMTIKRLCGRNQDQKCPLTGGPSHTSPGRRRAPGYLLGSGCLLNDCRGTRFDRSDKESLKVEAAFKMAIRLLLGRVPGLTNVKALNGVGLADRRLDVLGYIPISEYGLPKDLLSPASSPRSASRSTPPRTPQPSRRCSTDIARMTRTRHMALPLV